MSEFVKRLCYRITRSSFLFRSQDKLRLDFKSFYHGLRTPPRLSFIQVLTSMGKSEFFCSNGKFQNEMPICRNSNFLEITRSQNMADQSPALYKSLAKANLEVYYDNSLESLALIPAFTNFSSQIECCEK